MRSYSTMTKNNTFNLNLDIKIRFPAYSQKCGKAYNNSSPDILLFRAI